MSRKPTRGYFVRGHFVAEGSELDQELKRDAKGGELSKTDLKKLSERLQNLGEQLLTLPAGPFDVITCFHYLQRDLFPGLVARLAAGGWLFAEVATIRNLERHAHPSRRFLLEPGELRDLCAALEVVRFEEDWFDDRHLARLAARASA